MEASTLRADLKIGGQYTARQNEDGTYDILDVQIFTEVPAGAKRNKQHIGKEWQDKALLKNKARQAEGHLPPVHIYHSDEEVVKPIYAGKLRLKEVRQAPYQGQMQWTTFGDILGMPGDIFHSKVKPGFMPYRSVEIHDWDKPEIDSMALMDTDVPFFRMPMLTIGKVVKSSAEYFLNSKSAAYACFMAKAPSMAVLFKFGETPKSKKASEKDSDTDSGEAESQPAEQMPQQEEELDPNAGKSGEEDGDGEVAESVEHEGSENSKLDAVIASNQMLQTLLQQLLQRMGPQSPPEEKLEAVQGQDLAKESQNFESDKEDTMAEVSKDKVANAPTAEPKGPVMMKAEDIEAIVMRATQKAVVDATTPLMAEINALKVKEEKREKKVAMDMFVDQGVAELQKARRFVDDGIVALLRDAAEHGEEFVKKQVAVLKDRLPEEPPTDRTEFERTIEDAAGGVEPAVIDTFASKDKAKTAWAKKQLVAFQAYQEANPGTDITAQEWLDVNWRSESMRAVNRV